MHNLFFHSWEGLIRAATSTVLAYVALVAMLRISGKRTLAKMNAFDFIVTVALGSTFATVALSKDIALAEGALVFGLMIGMQFAITWLSVRFGIVKDLVASQPVLLVYKGKVLPGVMKKERILMKDLYAAIRKKAIADLKDVDAVVLETTGDLTVIPSMSLTDARTLGNVKNYPLTGDV